MSDMKLKLTIDLSEFASQLAKAQGDLSKVPSDVSVTITADGKQAQQEADDVEREVDELPDEKETKITVDSGNSLNTLNTLANAYVAVSQAISQVEQATAVYINKSNEQEKAEKHLQIALQQTGDDTVETFTHFKNFAAEIQKLTVVGDELIMPVMRLGLNMGILTEDLEEATKGAIGLSKGFNLDLTMAMKMHTLATQGDFNMLQRYIPALRQAETEAEKMAIVKKAEADGWAVATEEVKTGFGILEDYSNTIGDLQEKIGDFLKMGLTPLVEYLNVYAESIGTTLSQVNTIIKAESIPDIEDMKTSWRGMSNEAIDSILAIQESQLLAAIEATNNPTILTKLLLDLKSVVEAYYKYEDVLMLLQPTLAINHLYVKLAKAGLDELIFGDTSAMESKANDLTDQLNKIRAAREDIADGKSITEIISEEIDKFNDDNNGREVDKVFNFSDFFDMDIGQTGDADKAFDAILDAFDKAYGKADLKKDLGLIDKIAPSKQEVKEAELSWNQVLSLASNYVSQASNLASQLTQYRLTKLDTQMQKEIEAVENSTRSEEEKNKKIEEIQKKYQKKEAAERAKQKPVMIAQAIANTALGVTKALSTLDIPLALLIAASGAVEVATIVAQKYAKGGPIAGNKQYIQVNEEGPEYVINANATKQWKPLLDFINFGRADYPGMPKIAYAEGGLVNNAISQNEDIVRELKIMSHLMSAMNVNIARNRSRIDLIINGKKIDEKQVEEIDNMKIKMQKSGYDGSGESLSL